MSLALLKRYVELIAVAAGGTASREPRGRMLSGRGYLTIDAPIVAAQGIASGNVTVLVLALYTNTDLVHRLYTHHRLFWLLCVLFLYWINYMWLMAGRGRIPHDPILFALKNPSASPWDGHGPDRLAGRLGILRNCARASPRPAGSASRSRCSPAPRPGRTRPIRRRRWRNTTPRWPRPSWSCSPSGAPRPRR